jgi:hypothetical protein
LRASSSVLSSEDKFVHHLSLQDHRHPQTQQVDATPPPQSLWRDRRLLEGETHRWIGLARRLESNLHTREKLVFVQGNLGTWNAGDVFFKVTFLLVMGLMVSTALWILCHHAGQDKLDDPSTKLTPPQSKEGSNRGFRPSSPGPQTVEQPVDNELKTSRQLSRQPSLAFRKYDLDELSEDEKKEFDDYTEKFFTLESDGLVEKFGLSGYALMDLGNSSGVSKLPLRVMMPLTALQAWILQFCVLFYMLRRVVRIASLPPVEKDVPFSIIFAAVYLHFMNCINDLPFSMSIVRHIKDLHRTPTDYMIAMPVFLMDGLLIPAASLIIGALYLCTSATVSDVILNSCAVAFIGNIDNWLLGMVLNVNEANGRQDEADRKSCTIFIPVQHKLVKFMSFWLCTIPVVPWLFSTSVGYLGIYILHL